MSSCAQSGGTFHLADDRIERAVGVLRRTEIAQARVRLSSEAFQKRCREPRLADAGLAGKQHHLAFAALRLRPAPQQQFEFFFPSDEVGHAARVERLEAAFHRARSQRRPGSHRPRDTLEVLCSEVLKLEQIAEKPSCALGDDDHVRLSDPLQTGREVRRLADDAALLRFSRPIRSPTTTIPVAMPTRVCREAGDLSAVTAAINSSPARTARSASCSWACG